MATQFIEQMWRIYRDRTIPGNAPPDQLLEMRRAFHFGVMSILEHFMDYIAADTTSEEEGMQRLSDLWDEVMVYIGRIHEGKE